MELPKETASKKLTESNDPLFSEDFDYSPKLKFKKREGTTDLAKLYEEYFPAYVILKLLQDEKVKDFRLSANDEQFGAFDDLVLEVEYTNKPTEKYAIQLKHKENSDATIKNFNVDRHFSVLNFYRSFQQNKNELSGYKIILFTNAKFTAERNTVVDLGKDKESVKIRITECVPSSVINAPGSGQSYQFHLDPENSEEIKQKYKDFFERFFLYTNQVNVKQLEQEYIIRSFSALTSRSFVIDKFLKFISKWSVVGGIKTKLTKDMMIKVITLYIVEDLIQPHTSCDVNEDKKLFQTAMSHFNITAFNNRSLENVVKIWGDYKNILQNYDIKSINKIARQFQISTKYITNIDALTDEESTKLLWVLDKCPLIIKDHPAAYEAANLCGEKFKFVFITDSLHNKKLKQLSVFNTLSDLKRFESTYNDVIKKIPFTLFEEKTNLENLIKEDEAFEELITTNEIVKITDNLELIKLEEEKLCFPYVERHLYKNIIDFKYLQNLDKNTMVLISNVDDEKKLGDSLQNYEIVSLMDELYKNTDDTTSSIKIDISNDESSKKYRVFFNKTEASPEEFKRLCDKQKKYQIFHHFKYHDVYLEWIKSIGGVSDLQKFCVKDDNFVTDEKLIAENISNNLNIVIGDPGMGKSIFIKKLKNYLSSKYLTVIIYPTDIPEICDFLKNYPDNLQEFLTFILNSKFSNSGITERKILKLLMEKGKVVYLWDALDEIGEKDRYFIEKLIATLSKNSIAQFLTSRAFLQKLLEDKFKVLSQELQPFNSEQQSNYIEKRLESSCSGGELESITTTIKGNISDTSYCEILGIPLQIYMVTELFRQDLKKYKKLFTELFVITDLYSHFIEEKFNNYFKNKKGYPDNFNKVEIVKNAIDYQMEKYQQTAVTSLFGKSFITETNTNLNKFIEKIKNRGDEFGLITAVDINLQPEFLHNSYAEYLAATYLAENCRNIRDLENFIFEKKYANVRYFFDTLLAKKCPVHLAVLCKNLRYLQNCEDKDELKKKDMHGRNALHLAASWGERYPLLETWQKRHTIYINDNIDFGTKKENSDYHKIIETLLTNFDLYCENDQLFHFTPTMYAEKSECFFAAALIEKKQGNKNYLKTKNKQFVYSLLYYGIKYGFHNIVDLFANIKFAFVENRSSLLHMTVENNQLQYLSKLLEWEVYKQNINYRNMVGATPLMIASSNGYIETVKYLIEKQADVNAADKYGRTSLHFASSNGHLEMVKYLIEKQADVNAADKNGATSLHSASGNVHLVIVKYLIEKQADVNAASKYGTTSLHFAPRNRHLEIVKYLIEKQADVNAANMNGTTSLHFASTNRHFEIVQYLIEKQADVNAANNYGRTSLHFASSNGHLEIVKYLIEKQADVNGADKYGTTSLHFASRDGHLKIVEYLIEKQADVNAVAIDGTTSLHFASENGHLEIVEYLIKKQADVNAVDEDGTTSLDLAFKNGHFETVEYLIEKQADVNAGNTYHRETPFHSASKNGRLEILRYLTEKQAQQDVNAADKDGTTFLHLASGNGDLKTVKYLIEKQADVNAADNDGKTPLDLAEQNRQIEIVKYLKQNGARHGNRWYKIFKALLFSIIIIVSCFRETF